MLIQDLFPALVELACVASAGEYEGDTGSYLGEVGEYEGDTGSYLGEVGE